MILRGLKTLDVEISAIVTRAGDGGGRGIRRYSNDLVPPGGGNNCLCALDDMEPLMP